MPFTEADIAAITGKWVLFSQEVRGVTWHHITHVEYAWLHGTKHPDGDVKPNGGIGMLCYQPYEHVKSTSYHLSPEGRYQLLGENRPTVERAKELFAFRA